MSIKYVSGLGKEDGGKYYQYRFMVHGKVHTGSTGQEKLADAKKELARIRQKANSASKGTLYTPLWKEATKDWLVANAGKSKGHIRTATGFAFKHLGVLDDKRVDQIQAHEITTIVNEFVSGGGSKVSGNVIIRYYNSVMNWLVKKGSIAAFEKVPVESVQRKPKKHIPKAKLDDFFYAVDSTKNLHQSIAIRAMIYLGLREDEALNLKWECLDLTTQRYYLDHTKNNDTDGKKVHPDFIAWVMKLPHRKGLILPAEDGLPHRQGFTRKAMARASAEIEVKVTPHSCRVTFITTLAKKNLNAMAIQKLARHKDIRTTLGYTNLENSEYDEVLEKLYD